MAGTYFVSDAVVFNADARDDLVVDAVYSPEGRDDFYIFHAVVPASGLLALDDLVARAFHAPDGAGWVRFDLSHPHAVVSSRTYNRQPSGTAGTYVAGQRREEALYEGQTTVFLQEWRSGYRVNLGFTEISGTGAVVTAKMFDAAGKEAGSKTYTLGACRRMQVNSEPLFQQAGRIEVTVAGGAVLPFLTTVDNQTGDAVYQGGVPVAEGRAGERWFVPAVNRAGGANGTKWLTDLRMYNASKTDQDVAVKLSLEGSTFSKTVRMKAGETLAYDDAISTLFAGVAVDGAGALWATSPGVLAVTSRTYNLSPAGTYGLGVPARAGAQLLAVGERGNLIQLESDAGYRCNFALASLDDVESVVVLRAFDEKGGALGETTLTVPPSGRLQVNRIFEFLGATAPLASARLEVDVASGGRVFAYATVIDNKTGDAIFVEATR